MTRQRPKDVIQRAAFDHIRVRGVPGVVVWHPPNSGKRCRIEAAILKGLGVRAGASGLIAVDACRLFALDLKAEDGRPTEARLQLMADMEAAGAFTCVAYGLGRALAVLANWGLLRGRAS
jgi:hypothetical protein